MSKGNYQTRSPGSCGELVQGMVGNEYFLVTCPISVFANLTVVENDSFITAPPPKVMRALEILRRQYDIQGPMPGLQINSALPKGKGMASSSADIAAALAAVGCWFAIPLSIEEISRIAVEVEPTDAVFVQGIVRYGHCTGEILQRYGSPPALDILVFDTGGDVDTLTFNRRGDLAELNRLKEPEILAALQLLEQGFMQGDAALIGQAATLSAQANQRILPKRELDKLVTIGNEYGAVGVNVAHSGTVIGILLPPGAAIEGCRSAVMKYCPTVEYLCKTHLIGGGLQWRIGDDHEWKQW